MDENGEIWDVRSHPNYVDCLDFIKLCVANGYVPSEWETMDKAAVWDLIVADRVGTIGAWYSDHCAYLDSIWKVNPNAVYEPLVPFTYDPNDIAGKNAFVWPPPSARVRSRRPLTV